MLECDHEVGATSFTDKLIHFGKLLIPFFYCSSSPSMALAFIILEVWCAIKQSIQNYILTIVINEAYLSMTINGYFTRYKTGTSPSHIG